MPGSCRATTPCWPEHGFAAAAVGIAEASAKARWCFGKTPMETFLDALPLAKEKIMAA
jgi:hypothetical protein